MSSVIPVDPMIFLYWLLPAFLVMIIFFTWRESRLGYRFTGLRVLTQVVALVSLLAVLLRPTISVTESKPGIMLLTPNYSTRIADSLLMKENGLVPLVAPDANPFRDAPKLRSYHEVSRKGNVKFVLGDGIPTIEQDIVGDETYVFLASATPSGIVQLASDQYPANRRNWVRGIVNNFEGAVLRLIGPGGKEDSTVISGEGAQPFALRFLSKQAGHFTYALKITDPQGKASSEAIPVEVVIPRQLRILILQRYPIADVKFLKNYLAEKGHSVTVRYQLSKRNVRYEFANGGIRKFDVLSREILKSVDLLLTDDDTYGSLTGQELPVLEKAVREGMGMLVMFQHGLILKGFVGNVLSIEKDLEALDTIRYSIPGFGSFAGRLSPIRANTNLANQVNQGGLSGYRFLGDGKVGFQLLRESYSLSLGGETDAYAALWTPLLEQMARREEMTFSASVITPVPIYPDEPVTFEIISTGKVPRITSDGVRLPLLEDVRVDDVWFGNTWAGKPGWHSCLERDSVVRNYFVSQPGGWASLRTAAQQRDNRLSSGAQTMPDSGASWVVKKPVSPFVFFLLFLLSTGFLWLAPKL